MKLSTLLLCLALSLFANAAVADTLVIQNGVQTTSYACGRLSLNASNDGSTLITSTCNPPTIDRSTSRANAPDGAPRWGYKIRVGNGLIWDTDCTLVAYGFGGATLFCPLN